MIRIVKLYMLSIILILNAANIEQEIGINVGINSKKNEDSNKLKNPSLGLTYQNNKYMVAPRLDIDYTKVKDDYASSLIKISLNGVYEYENNTFATPYALAGVGYEYVTGSTDKVFESNAFVQAGTGLMLGLDDGLKARVEGKILKIVGGHNEGNELMLTAGISMPIGKKKKRVAPVKKVVELMPIPIEPILTQPVFVKPVVIEPVVVEPSLVYTSNNNECSIKINAPDLDRDGISNDMDQCPATPCNFTVDNYGCPIKATLKINFATSSAIIQNYSLSKVDNFANFLLSNKGSFVQIVGHTDSRGSSMKNAALSQRRANSVMNALINKGVSSSRLSAIGRGEDMPIASNNTKDGRAMNRRIEAELTYMGGKR